MAQFVVAAAGAAVGFMVGGPVGAQIGWGLGAMVGSSLGPGQHSEGPRLQDLRAPKAQYGAKWPRIYGRVRTAGIIVWQGDLEEVATTEHQGGKGGPDVSSTTFSYYRSVLFGFAEYAFGADIVPVAVTRIWRNGKLIWSALNDSEAATLDASAATTAFDSQTFFDGNAAQMPWTVYEAAVGTENANAYRYRATLGLERIAYGATDQMPYFEFELVTSADVTSPASVTTYGPWKWARPQTAYGWDLPPPEGHTPQSDYIFISPQAAAEDRLVRWAPLYAGAPPYGTNSPCATTDWYFTYDGTKNTPPNAFIASQFGGLEVQYLCGVGGQLGSVNAIISTASAPPNYSPLTEDLADIVSQEHLRANGGDSSEFDVSELVGIPVYGCAFADTARASIEQLMAAFYFEAVCSDKVYYHLRGGDSVVTVPFSDTAAGENQPSSTPFVGPARDNPAEIPGKVTVSYTNLNADYDAGSEEGDRVVTSSNEIRQYQVGIVTTPDKAKGIADTIAADNYMAAQKAKVQLDDSYAHLEPTDVVTDTDEDGNTYRMRIVETMYSGGAYDHQQVLDDASVLVEVGITSNQYTPVINLGIIAGDTELLLIDGPIESDADDGAGIYALLKPATGDSWVSGGALHQSTDGSTYSLVGTVANAATFGTASTTLGDYTGPRMFDEGTSVTVDVGDGTLSSSPNEAIINDGTINRFALGANGRWEYGQFRDAELISAGVYKLTGFLRGSRGTEHLTGTHTSSDTFALLNGVGQIRVPLTNAQIGSTLYYKGVTVGRNQSTAGAQVLTDTAVALLPFSPVDVQGVRDTSNNLTVTALLRSRYSVRTTGPLGIYIPVSDPPESYSMDVYADDTFASIVRANVTSATLSFSYPAADQTSDGLTPGDPVSVRIYIISAVVGRGTPAEATV